MNPAVLALIDLLDRSFDGDDEHSLLGNIKYIRRWDWDWIAPGGERTIRQVFEHAAVAKHAYGEHLFGEARRSFMDVFKASPLRGQPDATDELVVWAREGHRIFMSGMALLDDEGLEEMTTTHWGMAATKRWVIGVMIQHDCYHAGEINHLRALRQNDDKWWPEFRET